MFYTFEIGKYIKPVQLPSLYINLINSCRRSHLKNVMFLQSQISYKKFFRNLMKSLKNMHKNL